MSLAAKAATGLGALGAVLLGLACAVPSVEDPQWAWMPMAGAVFLGAYIYEVYQSQTWQYVSHVFSEADLEAYVSAVQSAEPRVRLAVQNFHYESSPYNFEQNPYQRTPESQPVRVDTHWASMDYRIEGHVDSTPALAQVLGQQGSRADDEAGHADVGALTRRKGLLLLCEFKMDFATYDHATLEDYLAAKEEFYRRNSTDTYQDLRECHSVEPKGHKFQRRLLAVLSPAGADRKGLPWWIGRAAFIVAVLTLMSLPYRMALFRATWKVEWPVMKRYAKDADELPQQPQAPTAAPQALVLGRTEAAVRPGGSEADAGDRAVGTHGPSADS